MRKPSQASHRSKEPEAGLNLSPILALLVILIPMLLAMFNLFHVRVQAVAAPKLGSGPTQKSETDEKPLNLTVLISQDALAIRLQEEHQRNFPPAMFAPIEKGMFSLEVTEDGTTMTQTVESHDYATLYNRLEVLKERFPAEETINIAAEMDTPWHIVARTIDVARVKLEAHPDYGPGPPFEGERRLTQFFRAHSAKQPCKEDCDGDGELTAADVEPVLMFHRVVFVVAE